MPERQRDGSPTKVDGRACRLGARCDLALAQIQPPPAPWRLLPEDAPSEIRVREPQSARPARVPHGTSVAAASTDMRLLAPGLLCSLAVSLLYGCSGSLGGGGTGGSAGSPGTVTLQIALPAGETFCDENRSCTSTQHLTIMTASGQPLALGSAGCGVQCSSCASIPCPELPVIACPAGNWGTAVSSSNFVWDGSYTEND